MYDIQASVNMEVGFHQVYNEIKHLFMGDEMAQQLGLIMCSRQIGAEGWEWGDLVMYTVLRLGREDNVAANASSPQLPHSYYFTTHILVLK